ncbi:hypothetical protein HF086_014963 [Spodoptera exigua]|uniref:Uncharacterized protein n=1 Tax=Spodoptera exigua TaxID=7107 RepID=A0A922SH12_SPOEX|nr:hypothetical protein HF086_014963 [Spodoptera exigua]
MFQNDPKRSQKSLSVLNPMLNDRSYSTLVCGIWCVVRYFIILGDDYEYTGGSGDGYQRSSKRSYHGSSSGGTASASSYHPYRR